MVLLIADDETIIRQGLSSLDWKSIGLDSVFTASNGLEAKAILETRRVDILLTDIRMPGLSGVELSAYIHQCELSTAVLFLTGYSDFEYAHSAIKLDVYDYILKPIRAEQLFASVKKVIRKQLLLKRMPHEHVEKLTQCFPDVRPDILDMLNYIDAHYFETISLEYFSKMHFISVAYISRLFKNETGHNYISILNAVRLYHSVLLLINQSYSIRQICDKVGFRDQRYFSTLFRKVYGYTPSQFRKHAQPVTLQSTLMYIGH